MKASHHYIFQKVLEESIRVPVGYKIVWGEIAPNVGARVNYQKKEIYIDEDLLKQKFKDKAWTKPRIQGVDPLPENIFTTLEEWIEFVMQHELMHIKYPRAGRSDADYENDINQKALEFMGKV